MDENANFRCNWCGAEEHSKVSFAFHVCDKAALRSIIESQRNLLERIYSETSAVTASGFKANNDSEIEGWWIDVPLYLELERFLYGE